MRIDFAPDPPLYPFRSHWFKSYAGQMHYIDEGAGAPILLCHGNPTWSFLYRKVITRLRGSFRCIAVDYLGFGLSERPEAYGHTVEKHARCVILGNTWFWSADLRMTLFSRVMSTSWMQRQILEKNLFVERIVPLGMTHRLTPDEMDRYRKVQPSPAARRGAAEMPRQLLAARPLLQGLASDVPTTLGAKPTLLVWGMKDLAFRPAHLLPRRRSPRQSPGALVDTRAALGQSGREHQVSSRLPR